MHYYMYREIHANTFKNTLKPLNSRKIYACYATLMSSNNCKTSMSGCIVVCACFNFFCALAPNNSNFYNIYAHKTQP